MKRDSPFAQGRRVFFSHIQKTGGTSLRHMLAEDLPEDRIYPGDTDPGASKGADGGVEPEADRFIRQPVERISRTWLVADHLSPCLMASFDADALLVIVLRDPVERALSHLGHIQRYVPRYAQNSLNELFDMHDVRTGLVSDYQVRFLSADNQAEAASPLKGRSVGMADLKRAVAWLERADAVGLTEQFDRSTQLIANIIQRPIGRPSHLNRAQQRSKAEAADPVLRARVADAVGLDRELHEAAVRRFDALWDADPNRGPDGL